MPLSLEELQSIADGDTVRTRDGTAVRTTGFNAPEVSHDNTGVAAEPGAALSMQLTREYMQQPGVSADVVGQDVYGRTLGRVTAPGLDSLAEEQLKRGLASPMATEGRISDAERRAYLIGQRERRAPSTPEQALINQQLDQEWRGATTNAPNVRKKYKRGVGDTFSDAIDRGLDQIGLMVGGTQRLLGEMTGLDSVVRAGDKRIRENQRDVMFNPADIGTMDNVKSVGDGFTYVVEKLGEQGPNLLATIGTAALTGGTGAALRVGAAKLASERVAMQAAASAMGAVGKGMTMTTGAALGAGTLNIGETKLHLDEIAPGGDHNFEALAVGGAKTALDLLSLHQMTGGIRAVMAGTAAPMTMKEVGKEIGKSTLLEGATEGTQGYLDEAAGNLKYGAPINWQNVTESAAVGAISGAGFATPMHAGSAALQRALAPRPGTPAADPVADPVADPAATRQEYDSIVQRVQELQTRVGTLEPDSAEHTATLDEIDALSRRGLELQQTLQNAQSPAAPRFSGPLNYTDWQALSDEDKQRYVNEVGMPPPPGGTTAEPASDIAAQLAAAADPNHPKKGVWMAGGGVNEARAAREAGRKHGVDLQVVTLNDGRERGLFASADPALRQKLYDLTNAGMPIEQALAENLYNIPADTKSNAVAAAEQGTDVPVVQNVNADGAVVNEAVSSPDELNQTQNALADQLGEGETQRVTTASEAQARRGELNSQGIQPYQTGLSAAYDLIQGVRSNLAADRAGATAPVDPRLPSTPSGREDSSPTVGELQARSPDTTVQGAELITRNGGQLWIAGDGAFPAADPNANLAEPGGPFVGPPTTDPGRVGDKAEHIAHKQLSEFNADAAMQLPQQLANPIEISVERGVVVPKDEQGNPIPEPSGPAGIQIVELPFGENPSNDVVDGHRYKGKSILNARPGERGWLGNPFVASDVRGGKLSRAEAVAKYKEALYARAASDPAFAAALQRLRGKKVGYYKPGEQDIHLQAVNQWLADNPAPNLTTMVPTAEGIAPQNPPERTAVPAGGTLVRYGKPGAPAQPATSIVNGARVQDRITRVAQEGQAKNRKPVDGSPKEGSGLQRLEARLRALPYVKRLMLVASRESSKVQIASGKKISVADRNNQILALVRDALLGHLDRVHGIESATQRERGTTLGAKYGSLLHQIANHVSDKDLNDFVEAAHNDKRNTLNAVGRAQGVSQDQSVGQAQQGRTLQDDDNGRAPAQEEYAGEEVEYEQGFNARGEDAPARAGLREFSDNLSTEVTEPPLLDREGKPTGKRWTLDQMFAELRQNPLFANNTPAEIAERFNKWVEGLKKRPVHLLASFVEFAHKTYAERASNPAAYNASSTAARRFESKVDASPALTAEQNDYQRNIADFGVTRDVNNAIDLSPEQAAYDQEQQAERARRGQPAEPVPKTERQVARFRGAIENKVNLDAAENDGLTADTESDPARQNVRTLAEMLFGDLAPVADMLNGLRNRTGQINAQQVVDSLLNKGKPSKVTRLLLSALKPFLAGYRIVFDAKASKPGSINPGNKVITIRSSMQSAEMLHVMLHEMVHAATVDALQNNRAFAKEITRLRLLAQAHLKKSNVRDADSLNEIKYGLTDNDEFVAQLFSSPAFVEFLETATDAADPRRTGALKTLFNEVISELKKVLGLADNVTLAAQAMDTVLSELAKGPVAAQSQQGTLFAPSIRPTIDAIRNAEPVQRVLNAPQGARLQALGREVATGTGRAKHFLSRAAQALLTSDHQLRQILTDDRGEAFANETVDRIYVRSGTKGKAGYLQRSESASRLFKARVESLLRTLEKEEVDGRRRGRSGAHEALANAWAETEEAGAALRQGVMQPLGPVASSLQEIFASVAAYIESAEVRGFRRAYGSDGYYLPQIADKGEIKTRFDEFVAALQGLEYVNPYTGEVGIFDHASATEYANAQIAEHKVNSLADLPWAGSLKHRTLVDPRAAARLRSSGFMESNVSNIINYYIDAVTKATEFEREFGGYAKTIVRGPDGFEEVDTFEAGNRLISGTLHGLYGLSSRATFSSVSYRQALARAVRDGVLEETDQPNQYRVWQRDYQYQRDVLGKIKSNQARMRFEEVFSGMQGNLGSDMNPQWRRTQQWLVMVESITTLGFSTLSSLTEVGILAAAKPGVMTFLDSLKTVVRNPTEAVQAIRDLGLSGEHISNIAMADNGVMRAGELPQMFMDKFFKLNGQHYWTQFTRAIAVQMFKSAAERFSTDGEHADMFDSYGVTREQVTQWLADGTPSFAVRETEADPSVVHPVTQAVHRFVDDHVAMPNRANVPAFFNNPKFALFVQLKRFFYAYGSQVIMRMARHAHQTYQSAAARGDTKAAAAIMALYPYLILAVFSLPLAIASREMKDYLKYGVWGQDKPNYKREGFAYWFDAVRRTGVLGPADLAVSLFDEQSGGMESLMGPLVAHLDVGLEHGFFSKEFAQRSTPVLGQLNGLWK